MAQALAVGAILATSPRTICAVLRILGKGQERHFINYHRVLNRDAWSCLAAGQILLGLIVALIPSGWPIVLAADETLEQRGGRGIKARGCSRDAVRSSRGHLIRDFGLKWIILTVLVPVPWSQRVWALPVLTTLNWPKDAGQRISHKTSIDGTRQMIRQVRRWPPGRELILVLDGSSAAVKLAHAYQRHQVALICRLRLDAVLYDPPGSQPPSKRGPKPKKGSRQRHLNAELDAIWHVTQAQVDLLTALGAPTLVAAIQSPQHSAKRRRHRFGVEPRNRARCSWATS